MKKLLILLLITTFSAGIAYAQDAVSINMAIPEIADYLDKRLPVNSVVAVLHIKANDHALANYIINTLINAMVGLENRTIVERANMDMVKNEMQFQLSGDVSEESAQAIGKMLGAQTIISGEIFAMNNRIYRLEIKAIAVETAAIQGSINKNILNDRNLREAADNSGSFPISIGGGVRVGGMFSEGRQELKGKEHIAISGGNYHCDYISNETNSKGALDIGAFIFLDLKYAEINMSLYNSSGNTRRSWNKDYYFNDYITNRKIHTEQKESAGSFSATMFTVGFLGKYPFYLNKITLYPALGADYQLWLLHSQNRKKVPGDLSANNSVWVKLGGGMDYSITRSVFIRTELLWGVKLPSKNESRDSLTYFTHSPAAHIGIGYVF